MILCDPEEYIKRNALFFMEFFPQEPSGYWVSLRNYSSNTWIGLPISLKTWGELQDRFAGGPVGKARLAKIYLMGLNEEEWNILHLGDLLACT